MSSASDAVAPMELDSSVTSGSDDVLLADYETICTSEVKQPVYRSPEAGKDRYQDVLPTASTRVKLTGRRSDYINANHVRVGVSHYVCTQAPLMETTNDFWLMVHQLDSRVIVMLTNLVEKGRIRCHKYWGKSGEQRRYGGLMVTMVKSAMMDGIILRKFRVAESSGAQERLVTQIHFTEWPDFGVPSSAAGLRRVLDIFEHYLSTGAGHGPPIVHCSAGLGRAGTFVAIHSSLMQLRTSGVCNVRETVKQMRQQRNGMIQTAEQYLFVYEALREILHSLEPLQSLLLSSSGESDENDIVVQNLMHGRSFNCLVDGSSQIEAPPASPFLMAGH